MKIVIATHNNDKHKELNCKLASLGVKLLSLNDFPEISEIVEDGNTLKDNALIKARTVHKITGLPSISDDTGLEVKALGGAPGVYTARYAGEECSYLDNVTKMLKEMQGIPLKDRSAVFKTVIAFVDNRLELTAEGIVKGMITQERKGVGGFGYDPIFYVEEKKKTFAEMTVEEKNYISHRGKAIDALKADLVPYLNNLSIKEKA